MGVTTSIAAFIKETSFDDIPAEVTSTAKYLVLDVIGVALAATEIRGAQLAIQYVRNLEAHPVSTVIGGGLRTAAADAAWCNGILGHCLEYEDAWPETMHPSSMVFPAALAVAEQFGRSGKDLIEGYIVGLEVIAKIRAASPNITHTRGWHGSSVYGTIAAAAAASKLLGLDVDGIRSALGIAASGAGGLIRQRGTMAKWYNQGNAARQGVTAALLARAGFTADGDIMDGPGGFMDVFHADGGFDLAETVAGLGKPFHITSPGVSIRKYPCGYVHQGVIDTLLDLLENLRVSYEDVHEVVVPVTPKQQQRYDGPLPSSAIRAKFNLRFPLAVALRNGKLGRNDFTDEIVQSPAVQEAANKIRLTTLEPSEIPEGVDPARYQAAVVLRLKDGREFKHRLPYPRGRYDDPTPKSVYVLPKFRDNAAVFLSESDIERCIDLVQNLESLKDLRALTDNLSKSKERTA